MHGDNDEVAIEKVHGSSYYEKTEARLTGIEHRLSVVEVDVAVLRSSCATKDDVLMLITEMRSLSERGAVQLQELRTELFDAIHRQ